MGVVPQSLISLENAVCVELPLYIFGIQRNVGDLAPRTIFKAKNMKAFIILFLEKNESIYKEL